MPRWLLPTLIVLATALFVTRVAIERHSEDKHVEASSATAAALETSGSEGEGGGEADERGSEPTVNESEKGAEDTLFGVDVESIPLVALAAVASIGLALAAWLRPSWVALLTLIAVVLVAFAALDIREVFHQLDEDNGGLAALAALVAGMHLAAGGVSAIQRQRAAA
jgi:hypothetical protein